MIIFSRRLRLSLKVPGENLSIETSPFLQHASGTTTPCRLAPSCSPDNALYFQTAFAGALGALLRQPQSIAAPGAKVSRQRLRFPSPRSLAFPHYLITRIGAGV